MANTPTVAEMQQRVARFKELKPHKAAFLDHVYKKNVRDIFNVIGKGVAEDIGGPQPEITAVEGFNVQMAGCQPGQGNGLHAHQTVEVFMALNGRWAVRWGERGEHEIILDQFDIISVPPGVMRCFENIGNEYATLMAILGGTDAGRLTWDPKLMSDAKANGWELDAAGNILKEGRSI
jgi:uncharacterized RmlC-like cupin family protein